MAVAFVYEEFMSNVQYFGQPQWEHCNVLFPLTRGNRINEMFIKIYLLFLGLNERKISFFLSYFFCPFDLWVTTRDTTARQRKVLLNHCLIKKSFFLFYNVLNERKITFSRINTQYFMFRFHFATDDIDESSTTEVISCLKLGGSAKFFANYFNEILCFKSDNCPVTR